MGCRYRSPSHGDLFRQRVSLHVVRDVAKAKCGENRIPHTFHTVDGSEEFLDQTLRAIGVPAWDVVAGRRGMEQRFYEFRADAVDVIGEDLRSAELGQPAEVGATQS